MEREIETERDRDRQKERQRQRQREFFLNFFDQPFQINVRNIRKIPSRQILVRGPQDAPPSTQDTL